MSGFCDHISAGIGWRERPGDGPVLVALHGIGSEARGFDALAGNLPDWRVIAWEAPGYGPSAPLPKEWPLARDYAAALEMLVDAIGLAEFHLVGHSLGTLIGAAYANAYPRRVKSLTLASCAQGGGVAKGARLPDAHMARLTDLESDGAAKFAALRAPRLVGMPETNTHLVDAVTNSMSKIKMPGYGQAVRMLAAGDLASDCARLQVPTAVIVGAEDIVTAPAQSIQAHQAIPLAVRGSFKQVENAGHALPLQAPKALAGTIQSHAGHARPQGELMT